MNTLLSTILKKFLQVTDIPSIQIIFGYIEEVYIVFYINHIYARHAFEELKSIKKVWPLLYVLSPTFNTMIYYQTYLKIIVLDFAK